MIFAPAIGPPPLLRIMPNIVQVPGASRRVEDVVACAGVELNAVACACKGGATQQAVRVQRIALWMEKFFTLHVRCSEGELSPSLTMFNLGEPGKHCNE